MNTMVRIAALLFLATTLSFSQAVPTETVTREVDELSKLLRDRQIGRIEILHMSDAILTRTDVTPEVLRRMCRYKAVITDPWESPDLGNLLTALSKIKASKPDRPGDLRWAILFFDVSGKERCAIYWNRFGTRGVFQDVSLSLDGRLLTWARRTISNAFLPSVAKRK